MCQLKYNVNTSIYLRLLPVPRKEQIQAEHTLLKITIIVMIMITTIIIILS